MSVATTGLPGEFVYHRPTAKCKATLPKPDAADGYTKLHLEEGEMVYVMWPPEITVKSWGLSSEPNCWNNMKKEAEEEFVTLTIRTMDRIPKKQRPLRPTTGGVSAPTPTYFSALRIIGPLGTTVHWYERLRYQLYRQFRSYRFLKAGRKLDFWVLSRGQTKWQRQSTGQTIDQSDFEENFLPEEDDSPDEDGLMSVVASRKQPHPDEASPVGSGIAGELTHPSDESGQIPKTDPGCKQEKSDQVSQGFPGFCEYAKSLLQAETQKLAIRVQCC